MNRSSISTRSASLVARSMLPALAASAMATCVGAVSVAACGGLVDDPAEHAVRVSPRAVGGADAAPPTHLEGESALPSPDRTSCPEDEPSEAHWCGKPFAVCLYTDGCSQRPSNASPTRNYQCTSSRWKRISAPYDVTCPIDLPAMDAPCETSCRYEGCDYPTACGVASAVCDPRTGTWQVSGVCADGGADGGADAG